MSKGAGQDGEQPKEDERATEERPRRTGQRQRGRKLRNGRGRGGPRRRSRSENEETSYKIKNSRYPRLSRSKEEEGEKRDSPYYVPLDQKASRARAPPRSQADKPVPAGEPEQRGGPEEASKQAKRKPAKARKPAGRAQGSPRSRDEEPRGRHGAKWLQNLDNAIRMPSFGCHYVAVDRDVKPNQRRNSKADDSLPGIAIVIPADIFFRADIQNQEDILHFLGIGHARSDSRDDRR